MVGSVLPRIRVDAHCRAVAGFPASKMPKTSSSRSELSVVGSAGAVAAPDVGAGMRDVVPEVASWPVFSSVPGVSRVAPAPATVVESVPAVVPFG